MASTPLAILLTLRPPLRKRIGMKFVPAAIPCPRRYAPVSEGRSSPVHRQRCDLIRAQCKVSGIRHERNTSYSREQV
jgi:hypothetical protein